MKNKNDSNRRNKKAQKIYPCLENKTTNLPKTLY